MKKLMWSISLLSLVCTAFVLRFLPDCVPMHYDLAGNIDRWGSKYENLLFPVVILLLSLFWHLLSGYFGKKATQARTEKERAEGLSNVKLLNLVGVCMAALFTVMQGFILYGAHAAAGAARTPVDLVTVCCALSGIAEIFLGNYLPKAKRNRLVGVRVRWSLYNDTTWMKSNRFGGAALMLAGLASVLTCCFAPAVTALVLHFVCLLAAVTVTLFYSHSVYRAELSKNP